MRNSSRSKFDPAGTACGPIGAAFDAADGEDAADDEMLWYADRLPRDAGPVLDAMCGTGRLLVPLAMRGLHVHGVDASAAVLAVCEARLAASAQAPKLYRQQPTELNLPFRYGAAYLARGSFQRIADPASAHVALERLRAHLVSPGLLLLDLDIPEFALHPPGAAVVEIRAVKLPGGGRITLRSETTVNGDLRTLAARRRLERREPDGALEREDELSVSTWYDEAQIRALLEECGYVDIAIEPPASPSNGGRVFGVRARATA